MKRLIVVLILIFFCMVLLGCQVTPDKSVVVQKDMEQMIDTAVGNNQLDCESTEASMTVIPERYTTEPLHNAQGTLTVNIDAEVFAPTMDGMTTARVAKHLFTEEEAAKLVNVLFEGQQTYSGDALLTKQHYQDRILQIKAQLAAETDEQNKQGLTQSIQKYQSAINNLPEGEGFVEAFPEFLDSNGADTMFLVSDGSNGLYRTFTMSNRMQINQYKLNYSCCEGNYLDSGFNFYDETIATELRHGREAGGNPEQIANPQISAEQAKVQTDALIAKLDIGDFTCRRCDLKFGRFDSEWFKAYELVYMRQIGGVPFTYINIDCDGAIDDGKGGFIEGWAYEKLSFLVDDSGIIYMSWTNPYDVTEILTEDSVLLPFNQVMETFEKMIVVTNADSQANTTYDIDRITLGLARITDTQTREQGLVIPVWDFFGTLTVEDGEKTFLGDNPTETRLTINAIDGSIIDRGLGY